MFWGFWGHFKWSGGWGPRVARFRAAMCRNDTIRQNSYRDQGPHVTSVWNATFSIRCKCHACTLPTPKGEIFSLERGFSMYLVTTFFFLKTSPSHFYLSIEQQIKLNTNYHSLQRTMENNKILSLMFHMHF